jgi:hypothetical protein
MDRAALLARAQAAAEAGMVDTCTIRRVTGEAMDPNTGVVGPTYLSPDPYAGKCRVQQHQATADQHDAGQDYLLLLRLEVQLPMAVAGLEVGDEVTITASAYDPDLPGRVFLIHDLAHKTEATARRVQCTERTGS